MPCTNRVPFGDDAGGTAKRGITARALRNRDASRGRTLLDRLLVRAGWPAHSAQGRRRPHRGASRRADEGAGRARAAPDAGDRSPAPAPGGERVTMERGRAGVLPAARAEGPAQVAPPDRRRPTCATTSRRSSPARRSTGSGRRTSSATSRPSARRWRSRRSATTSTRCTRSSTSGCGRAGARSTR